jgi:hypothetical protein
MRKYATWTLLTLLLSSCLNDKSLEDYNREQAREDESKLLSAAGSYRGELYSTKLRAAVGVIQVDFSADRQVNQLDLEKTVLKTTVFFSGKSPIYLSSNQTYYDWKTGRFNAEFSGFTTAPNGGKDFTLRMDGSLDGTRLKGQFELEGYEDYVGDFTLSKLKERQSAESFFRSGQIGEELKGQDEIELNYSGTIESMRDSNSPSVITLFISNTDVYPPLRFAELFSPKKSVRAVLTFGRREKLGSGGGTQRVKRAQAETTDGFSLTFNSGSWEPSLGILTVDYQSMNPIDRTHFSLRCSGYDDEERVANPSKIQCKYQSSERGITRVFKMNREGLTP